MGNLLLFGFYQIHGANTSVVLYLVFAILMDLFPSLVFLICKNI